MFDFPTLSCVSSNQDIALFDLVFLHNVIGDVRFVFIVRNSPSSGQDIALLALLFLVNVVGDVLVTPLSLGNAYALMIMLSTLGSTSHSPTLELHLVLFSSF
jgi:hypothetical protein